MIAFRAEDEVAVAVYDDDLFNLACTGLEAHSESDDSAFYQQKK